MHSPIDFAELRRVSGAPPGRDVLAHIDEIADERQRCALAFLKLQTGLRVVLTVSVTHSPSFFTFRTRRETLAAVEAVERAGVARMTLAPGLGSVLHWLESARLRRGLVTRNHSAAVDAFHSLLAAQEAALLAAAAPAGAAGAARSLAHPFSPALSREFRPYKPDPAPLLHICAQWEVQPQHVLMVGDSHVDECVLNLPLICRPPLLISSCEFVSEMASLAFPPHPSLPTPSSSRLPLFTSPASSAGPARGRPPC